MRSALSLTLLVGMVWAMPVIEGQIVSSVVR